MALSDISLRAKYNRLLARFEASLATLSRLVAASVTSQEDYVTFADRAAFLASNGAFRFAWLNNANASDGIASFWVRADDAAPSANASDVQTVNGHKFIQLYVRENA